MSQLEPTTDFTGNTSQTDINAQDISNLIDEFNRSQSAVDRTVNGTDFYYDGNGINYMQIGILPDGTTGIVIAKSGINVADAFS